MSDERFKKIVSSAPATPNAPSIMSAPCNKGKTRHLMIIVVALVVSIALNVVLAVVSLSKNEHINQMEKDIKDYKADIIDLKNKVNTLSDSL